MLRNAHGLNLERGRRGRLGPPRLSTGDVDWFATLSCGRPRQADDVRRRFRYTDRERLLLVVLDSSGSTLKRQALTAAKGAVLSLLEVCYRKRDRIALLQFAANRAQLTVSPQRAPKNARDLLQDLAGGGGTPLRQGLVQALQVLAQEHRRHPHQEQMLMLLTDGRSRDSVAGIAVPCPLVIVDLEAGPVRLGRCRQLAETLNGDYLALDDLPLRH